MISILVLAIITLSVISIASIALMETIKTQDLVNKSVQNTVDLNIIKKSLILSAKNDVTYGTVLPYGVNDLNYHKLPEFVYIKRKNQFNRDYIYCPFAVNQNSLTKGIKLNDSVQYMVDTANISHNGVQREYVISSHNSPFHAMGVQAIIISPVPPFSNNANCLNVVYDSGLQKFLVEGGRVEVITTTDILIGI